MRCVSGGGGGLTGSSATHSTAGDPTGSHTASTSCDSIFDVGAGRARHRVPAPPMAAAAKLPAPAMAMAARGLTPRQVRGPTPSWTYGGVMSLPFTDLL